MLVTTVKGLTCSNYKVKVNMNIVAIAYCLIKLEAIIIHNYASPPGYIYYIVALKFTCGALKCYGPVACKLNICLYHRRQKLL